MSEITTFTINAIQTPSAKLRELAEEAMEFVEDSLSKNTRRSYRADWNDFVTWCESHEVSFLPSSDQILAMYLTDQSKIKRASTLRRRLIAIKSAHDAAGLETPTDSKLVRQVWKGIVREKGSAQRGKEPVLTEDIRRMVEMIPDDIRGLRDRAMLLIGFSGGFRRSELVAIQREHVQITREGIRILIPKSKTDQEGQGRTVGISYGSRLRTCPVRTLEDWITSADILSGPLFRRISKSYRVLPYGLNDKYVSHLVKKYASECGLDPDKYGGHSLRAGLATQAAMGGANDRAIMAQTGHKSREVMERYIRDANIFRDNASRYLGL